MVYTDTIAAIATALSSSGIGIIRISGIISPTGKNDSPPEALRPRGDYLYDKGENDELFHINLLKNSFI